MPTSALEAPTLETPTMSAPAPPPPVPRRSGLQPWLLVVPLIAVTGGALVVTTQMWRASPVRPVEVASAPQTTLAAMAAPTVMPPSTLAVPAASPRAAVIPTSVTSLVTPPPDSAHAARPVKGFGVTTRPPTAASVAAAAAPAAPPTVTVPPSTLATEPGQLQVAVRPWGEVSVDGRVIGTTPLDRITLPAGTHVVRVRHAIRPGETAKMVVDLPTQGVRKP